MATELGNRQPEVEPSDPGPCSVPTIPCSNGIAARLSSHTALLYLPSSPSLTPGTVPLMLQ